MKKRTSNMPTKNSLGKSNRNFQRTLDMHFVFTDHGCTTHSGNS